MCQVDGYIHKRSSKNDQIFWYIDITFKFGNMLCDHFPIRKNPMKVMINRIDKAPCRGLLYELGQSRDLQRFSKTLYCDLQFMKYSLPGHVHFRELADVPKN